MLSPVASRCPGRQATGACVPAPREAFPEGKAGRAPHRVGCVLPAFSLPWPLDLQALRALLPGPIPRLAELRPQPSSPPGLSPQGSRMDTGEASFRASEQLAAWWPLSEVKSLSRVRLFAIP